MKISANVSNLQFQGLVPYNQYKGPLLKLTKSEKDKISKLQENINQAEFELYHLQRKYEGKFLKTEDFDYYAGQVDKLMYRIEELKELIRNIKINRLTMQKNPKVNKGWWYKFTAR